MRAARALALRTASASGHFGPFLADLAERSLRTGREPGGLPSEGGPGLLPSRGRPIRLPPGGGPARFSPEVRAAGLARALATGFGRSRAAILVDVPDGLSPLSQEVLAAGCEWFAHRGGFGIWLTGAALTSVDRIGTVPVPAEVEELAREVPGPPPDREPYTVTYPALAGRPHPGSGAEQALETALARCDWAAGREWNRTYHPHPLAVPIRMDLLWRDERCVVEIDGPDHRTARKYAQDRQRDIRLQQAGYAVLRFTDDQVMTDMEAVLRQVEWFVRNRRHGTPKG
ncbi:DUF559 domain-containing protein [Planomonospora venezuelensis]|uniref:DUF559 domain-containing protein n=1 Tax=Planomonospora venezuelensis TaxID=1999 RepID=A0A841D3U9_PLAVE|nr:hypothetical protein [Planomonospora venezuelensis]